MIQFPNKRTVLIQIINTLPEKEILVAEAFLKFLASRINDPVLAMLLSAEEDNEPLSGEEIAEMESNRRAYMSGDKGIPWEEARKELTIE